MLELSDEQAVSNSSQRRQTNSMVKSISNKIKKPLSLRLLLRTFFATEEENCSKDLIFFPKCLKNIKDNRKK